MRKRTLIAVLAIVLALAGVFVGTASADPVGGTTPDSDAQMYHSCFTANVVEYERDDIEAVCTAVMTLGDTAVWVPLVDVPGQGQVEQFGLCAVPGDKGFIGSVDYLCVRAFNAYAFMPINY
jgi:hypothetical protein